MLEATTYSAESERSRPSGRAFALKSLLDALPVPAFGSDEHGRLAAFNESARARLGFAPSDVGTACSKLAAEVEIDRSIPVSVTPLRDVDGRLSGALHVAIEGPRRTETDESIRTVLAAIPSQSNETFFDDLVVGLCSAFGVDWAMVATLDPTEPNIARSLATSRRGAPQGTFVYDLRGTPCENVVGRDVCVYPRGLQALFPEDKTLVDLGIEGYAGAPLISSAGEPIGLIALLHERELPNAALIGSLIGFVAARASAELERLRARDALRESERSLRLVQSAGRFGSWEFDGVSRFKLTGELFNDLGLARLPNDLGIAAYMPSVHPDDHASIVAVYGSMLAGEAPEPFEVRVIAPNGDIRTLRVHAEAVRNSPSGGPRFVGASADVTDRKRFEVAEKSYQEGLLANARLASMGALAAGVAHEINNPLAYVFSNLDLAVEAIRSNAEFDSNVREETSKCLRHALEGVERVRRIVRGLKSFARGGEERRRAVDVRAVIDAACELADNQIRHRARLVKDYADAPLVFGDASRLEQVVLNLLVNAVQAMPEGSTRSGEIRVVFGATPGGDAFFEVRDDGEGMHPEVQQRAFEPFFTTKPPGVGTGLGLSICHGIVTAHGGSIVAASTPGVGTTMRVELPAAPVAASAAEVAAGAVDDRSVRDVSPPAADAAERRDVLIVDDDEMVGDALRRALQKTHRIALCTSSRDATRRILESNADVILCDLMMPDVTGMQVYAEVLKASPKHAERMVFMTGGAFTPEAQAFLARVRNVRFEKPLRPAQLRTLVSEFRARSTT